MTRLTFDDLTPDDMPEPVVDNWGDRADTFRDSLGDLVKCGKQTTLRMRTMPLRTVDEMLRQRQPDAKIAHDEENARTIRDLVDTLDDLFYDKDVDWMTDEQVCAMWCADPEDTFNMLGDWVARLGLDEDELQHIASCLFEMLPTESQDQLRELEAWGVV